MNPRATSLLPVFLVAGCAFAFGLLSTRSAESRLREADLTQYSSSCGVDIRTDSNLLKVRWPLEEGGDGRLTLNLNADQPLIAELGLNGNSNNAVFTLRNLEPFTSVTVGSRVAPTGRPPTMSIWNTFFDKPASRPFETFTSRSNADRIRVVSHGRRVVLTTDSVQIGGFSGDIQITVYAGSPLIHIETVVSTAEDGRAILYDAGLVSSKPDWRRFVWLDTEGRLQSEAVEKASSFQSLAVRHRSIIAEADDGSVVCFPPPHQFQFPRDWTDNLKFVWTGKPHKSAQNQFGLGIRQVADGGRAFEPWFNAPPGTKQRLGVFYLITPKKGLAALEDALRYTHQDHFPPLPGYITFTSHYHMAVAVTAMQNQFRGVPEFVGAFKEMGVDAVHIGDFHGDGHPKDPGPLRLPEMEAMFRECRRLSDDKFLLIPGEEINEFLGLAEPGKHPGHWMSLFPKPVYWIEKRQANQPFAEQDAKYGTLYRVGSRQDMAELLRREHGLAWSAHPRIKASSWTPDIFRNEDFYLADFWLGGAWKAMPADLSRERLGERGLDLLDDMANWGQKKYLPGEVDVFKIDHTHELYGHMNINYLKLDRLPRFDEGWQPILDVLRAGRFFVTTGEILIRNFKLDGHESGATLRLKESDVPELKLGLEWTFPLRFVEIISGDGNQVYRERLDLADTGSFQKRDWVLKPKLTGRKWMRVEVWDVGANGAFTQPIWLDQATR